MAASTDVDAGSPLVSVVLPARDQAHRLPTFLEAIRGQTLDASQYEVIVVDDASVDGTAGVVAESGFARVIGLAEHGGPYVARNIGLEQARGRLVAFTDADCSPSVDWLERGAAAFEARGMDILVGHIDVRLGDPPTVVELIDFGRYLDQRRNAEGQSFGGTGNLWIRREIINRTGRFNDQLLAGGDKEFCQRSVAGGATLEYVADVATEHPPCRSNWTATKRAFRIGYGKAQYRYYTSEVTRDYPHICTRPGAYVPRWRIFGIERLKSHGYPPTRRQRLAMPFVNYFTFTLPIALGNLTGTIRDGWLRGGWKKRRQALAEGA